MTDWMGIDPHLLAHRKFKRLRHLLPCTEDEAIAGLFRLWAAAFDHAQDGDLSAWLEDEIDDLFGLPGALKALRSAGFIDADNQIHDWFDFAGRLFLNRKGSRKASAAWRAKKGGKPKPAQPAEKPRKPAPLHLVDDDDHPFLAFWGVYPNKQGKLPAARLFAQLSLAEKRAAYRGATHYAKFAKLDPDAPLMHGDRFLSKSDRCWEEWAVGIPKGRLRGRGMAQAAAPPEQKKCPECGSSMRVGWFEKEEDGVPADGPYWSCPQCSHKEASKGG